MDEPRTLPPTHLPSPTHSLTKESLNSLQQSLLQSAPSPSYIVRWTENCLGNGNPEAMAAPAPPRSTSAHHRGLQRRPAHSSRSRTPSPSKRPTPQTYRTRNLAQAKVYIERLPRLPAAVDEQVRQILGIDSWQDPVEPSTSLPDFQESVTWYQSQSQRHVRQCTLEGEWKMSLAGLLTKLADLWGEDLQVQASEKGLSPSYKPLHSVAYLPT